MIVKLLFDRVGFQYCNGLIRRLLCLAFVPGIFSGPPLAHAAPPVPDPRFGAVEAHMLPDAAASLRPGWDRLRFDWGARQQTIKRLATNNMLATKWGDAAGLPTHRPLVLHPAQHLHDAGGPGGTQLRGGYRSRQIPKLRCLQQLCARAQRRR